MTECPQCGGELYDNRQKVAGGWKGPIFKCKDADGCGWKKWPPKPQGGGGGGKGGYQGNRGAGGQRGGNTRPLGPLYADCLKLALRIARKEPELVAPTNEQILSMTATIFIAASRDGTALVPPPKPKEPEPTPEDEYEYDETMGF